MPCRDPLIGLLILLLGIELRAQSPDFFDFLIKMEQERIVRDATDPNKLPPDRSEQHPKYKPENASAFEVKSYWIDADRLHVFKTDQLPLEYRNLFIKETEKKTFVRLLVHPESEAFYSEFLKDAIAAETFIASATASGRTLLVHPKGQPQKKVLVKVSLDRKLGGASRTIPAYEVAQSVVVSQILERDPIRGFRFLPEALGIIPKNMDRGGMIVRVVPKSILSDKNFFIPLFALYGTGRTDKTPLIGEMISKSGKDATEFVESKILKPFAELWVEMAMKGVVAEAHAQNVLIGISPSRELLPEFLFRDLGGFNIDLEPSHSDSIQGSDLPDIDTVGNKYFSDLHDSALEESLNLYFSGGFLYGLESKLNRMIRLGKLEQRRLRAQELQDLFRSYVESSISQRTGQPVHLEFDYSNLAHEIKKAKLHTQRCRSILGHGGNPI